MFAIGKTNAALPINTSAKNSELTPIEVPGLNQRERYKSGITCFNIKIEFCNFLPKFIHKSAYQLQALECERE